MNLIIGRKYEYRSYHDPTIQVDAWHTRWERCRAIEKNKYKWYTCVLVNYDDDSDILRVINENEKILSIDKDDIREIEDENQD